MNSFESGIASYDGLGAVRADLDTNELQHETLSLMEHKGLEYTVVQTSSPTGWMWMVRLDDGRTRTGMALNRTAAVRLAQIRIEKALKKRSRQLERS